jgi:hypothetical protein
LLLGSCFNSGCLRGSKIALPVLGRVTLIKVKKDGKEIRTKISDEQSIVKIIEFVDARNEGWEKPWYGIPVPTLEIEFYDGQDFKGSFGVGKGFFRNSTKGRILVQNRDA